MAGLRHPAGSGQVPLARRNLLADRRRLGAGVVGIGLAIMLILLLQGMWAGVQRQATVYPDSIGANVYVLQPGVRDLTAGASTLPAATLAAVRTDPDVTSAAPVRTAYMILTLHQRKVAVYVVGSVPDQTGGAWSVASGRTPRADNEITVGRLLARRHGIHLGDRLDIGGRTFDVVGLSNSTGFMFDYVFLTHDALTRLAGTPGQTSMIIATSTNPSATLERLRANGLNALDVDTVTANNLHLATGIFASPIKLMVAIGFAAGTLIVALTAYTAINERRREYGIVKTLGATPSRLIRLAMSQTLTVAALGLVAGILLFLAGRILIEIARPQFQILLTVSAVERGAVAALAMALIAAIVPARRLATLSPVAAYGGAP